MRRIGQQPVRRADRRRGAALVEFAILAPVFLSLVIGTIAAGKALETGNIMSSAVREGGRLASMDWGATLPDGTSANQKVKNDILNFLAASSLPSDQMNVTITHAEGANEGLDFDLEDPENRLKLFRIKIELPFQEGSPFSTSLTEDGGLTSSMVFRAARTQLGN